MINGCKVIAVCAAVMENENRQELVYPLHHYLEKFGWKTLIFHISGEMREMNQFDYGELAVFDLIPYKDVDAVMILGRTIKQPSVISSILNQCNEYNKPAIVIDGEQIFSNAINVTFGARRALSDLVHHLVNRHGIQKVGIIAGEPNNEVSDLRVEVIRSELSNYNISVPDYWFDYGGFYREPTLEVLKRFMDCKHGLPEAIICINDSMAIAACEYLIDQGYSIPTDIMVTGFDGIVQERYTFPRLTTCRRDMDLLAVFMGDLIMNADKQGCPNGVYNFDFTFEASESCGCRKIFHSNANKAINTLYQRMRETAFYDHLMGAMFAKLSVVDKQEDTISIIEEYQPADGFFCMNGDRNEKQNVFESHSIRSGAPFYEMIDAFPFFSAEHSHPMTTISLRELIPDWSLVFERSQPLVFGTLHNQEQVIGYAAFFADDDNFYDFGMACSRIQRFTIALNNTIALSAKESHLRIINRQLEEVQHKIISAFAEMVESRDESTGKHTKRTAEYIAVLMENMRKSPEFRLELSDDQIEMIRYVAPLHDIGKIKVPDSILNKPGRLTSEEFDVIKTHAAEGGRMLEVALRGIETDDYLEAAIDVAMYHHEKWNGGGYPYGLEGNKIPLSARMMAVVDVFDALTSKRVYKDANSLDEAFSIIQDSAGTHFDPNIVRCFMEVRDKIEEVFYQYAER